MKKFLACLLVCLMVLAVVASAAETITAGETQPLFLRFEFGTKTKAGDAGLTDNEYLKSFAKYDAENIKIEMKEDTWVITALKDAAITVSSTEVEGKKVYSASVTNHRVDFEAIYGDDDYEEAFAEKSLNEDYWELRAGYGSWSGFPHNDLNVGYTWANATGAAFHQVLKVRLRNGTGRTTFGFIYGRGGSYSSTFTVGADIDAQSTDFQTHYYYMTAIASRYSGYSAARMPAFNKREKVVDTAETPHVSGYKYVNVTDVTGAPVYAYTLETAGPNYTWCMNGDKIMTNVQNNWAWGGGTSVNGIRFYFLSAQCRYDIACGEFTLNTETGEFYTEQEIKDCFQEKNTLFTITGDPAKTYLWAQGLDTRMDVKKGDYMEIDYFIFASTLEQAETYTSYAEDVAATATTAGGSQGGDGPSTADTGLVVTLVVLALAASAVVVVAKKRVK